jgi:hypothetical protein
VGTLTLSQLRDEVRSGLGNRTELVSDSTRVDRWLNLAQIRMTRRSRYKELDATESKTPTYAGVPATDKVIAFSALTNSNVRAIYSVRMIDGNASSKLTYVPHRMWDREVPRPEAQGLRRPSLYTVYAKQIELYAIPDAAYEYIIRLAKWPTALTAVGQLSDLAEKDDALIAMACYLAFRSLGNAESAKEWFAEYRAVIGDAMSEDDDNPDFDATPRNRTQGGMISDYWIDPFQGSNP